LGGFQLLERDRGRGDAERVHSPTPAFDALGANEARWLLTLHAANLLHAARTLILRTDQRFWSRQRFRAHVLKVPARVTLGRRRVTVWIPSDRSFLWADLARAIEALPPARGSRVPRALSAA